MPDADLKELRDQFQNDLDEWAEARLERAHDMRCLAGDPFSAEDKLAREEAKRPLIVADELSQYVNQIVNEVRANPRAVQFAPTGPGTSEDVADFYANKMREIEYRSHAQLAYTTAFESAVMGGYGFVRVTSEFQPDSADHQELVITPVVDPNTVVPDPRFQRPDLSDMKRCFVLEHRKIAEFKRDFPKAQVSDFGGYLNDKSYASWVNDDRVLLAEYWCVHQTPIKLLLVQPPSVAPPSGQYGLRPPVAPPPITIPLEQWAQMPEGSKVLRERDAMKPRVVQQLVNGVEILDETSWPGPYIPIAGCMGRVLYLDDTGTSKRLLMSAVRLAREPFEAYCFYRTCEMENVGMTTKNPYWAYEGQISPEQQQDIAKSLHEPVAVLFAKAVTAATGQQVLPLPQRNISEPAIQALSMGAEEMRRAVQAAMATNFLPTQAQRQNEKSGIALDKIDQARQKGSFHFVDHYEMMLRHVGCICEAAMDEIYDTEREVLVRKGDDSTEHIWVNSNKEGAIKTLTGQYATTVSSGPSVDSTREAGSEFADMLLASQPLMALLGPQKSAKIAALAVKLKVKQTGIGAIGEQIVDIIDPPKEDGQEPNPEALMAKIQEANQLLQMAQAKIQELEQDKAAGVTKEKLGAMRDSLKGELQVEIQKMKGQQALALEAMRGEIAQKQQDDKQAHDLGMEAEGMAHEAREAERSAMMQLAGGANEASQPEAGA